MKRSDIDQTSGDERDVEHVLQALTTASGVESDGEVQVLEVNQDTGIIRFITNNMVVRTLATALNFSGDLVRAIYRAIPSISVSDAADTTDDIITGSSVDEDEALSEVNTSSLPTSTESIAADLSDRMEDDDDHVEEVVVSPTDPLDDYVSSLNVEALASEARESGALALDSALGRVFTPDAMHELGIDGMQHVPESHGLYRVSHTAKSSIGASRQKMNAKLAGQVLAHPDSVAEIIRGTRGRISSVVEADELGDVDVEPLDGNVFEVSTTGNTVTTTFNLFAFLQLLSLHCTSALTTPIIAQVIGSEVDSYTVHLGTLRNYVGAGLAELIFNPEVGMDGKIGLTPVMLPQLHHEEAVDAITPKSLFSIAIDTSDSMNGANQMDSSKSKLDVAKEKLKATIAKLTSSTPDWTIVLTKFGSETKILETFHSTNSTPEDIYLVIDQLKSDGMTRLYGTASEQLEYIMKLASSGIYTHFASILFTDGNDNASGIIKQSDVIDTAGSATDVVDNLQIFTLELGDSNHQFFIEMAKVSGCTHIPLSNMSDLSAFDGYIRLLSKDTSVVKFLTEAFETFSRMVALEGEITVGKTIIRPDAKFEVNGVLHCIAAPKTTLAEIHDGIFLTELHTDESSQLSGESAKTIDEVDGHF